MTDDRFEDEITTLTAAQRVHRLLRRYRILGQATAASVGVLFVKLVVDALGWEFLAVTPLHTAIIAGGLFVISFVLSAAITDYKEGERLPAEFAATVESMYEDVEVIARNHPGVDLDGWRHLLLEALDALRDDAVAGTRETHHRVFALGSHLAEMEALGVPPNYIVKLKQEQSVLVRSLFRINYIQTIRFVPSAYALAQTISVLVIGILVFTLVDPVATGMAVSALIALVFIYMLLLIRVISRPFHPKGATMDDVSLFLVDRTRDHLVRAAREGGHSEHAGTD